MIPLPEGITTDDISQWLSGGICMVQLPGEKEFQPAAMERVIDHTLLQVRLMSDEWAARRDVPVTAVRAHWPMCGSVNVQEHKCATHVERLPEKQYRRTFSTRLMHYTVPRAWDIQKRFGLATERALRSGSNAVLRGIYKPMYPANYDEALTMLASGWLSVAINPRIIVAGDDAGKRMIYYRGELAATITGDEALAVSDDLTTLLVDKATDGRYTWIKE